MHTFSSIDSNPKAPRKKGNVKIYGALAAKSIGATWKHIREII